jgi:hypothetical protein
VQSWQPRELLAIGDLAYNAGGSTVQDISIGQYYNNFIYPYPSPEYLSGAYLSVNGSAVQDGQKTWPYNVYNFPLGFPSPLNGSIGGSPDQKNHFWGALGNHDYGMEVGYGQVGVTPYDVDGNPTGNPVGPSSTTSVRAAIDYFLPYLANPSLLGEDQARLNVGAVDPTGNRGAYYSISFGGTVETPLIEFFQLDTERLNVNAGFEDWNPSGMKVWNPVTGLYENKVEDNKQFSLTYDPSDPTSLAFANTTNDLDNGYDQFIWLRDSLVESKATWKVITGHHPVYASGRWADRQPDDHMSNPYMQRLLNALPEGSFDAYYNGHDHFYERVLESKAGGIGLGVPFITNGNSGRNLSKKIQVPYGTSVYEPLKWNTSPDPRLTPEENEKKKTNPNIDAKAYLLDSGPLEVAASGLSGGGDKAERNEFSNGLYGYGFGATRVEVEEGYLLFHYEEAEVVDPAIANHLSDGASPEPGFAGTTKDDWIPNPTGEFLGKSDLARFQLSITNGVVTGAQLVNGGRGYMTSKGGNHVVEGFNIYGNNVDPLAPWVGTAQVDLSFFDGRLNSVTLKDGGRGYELAVQAAAEKNYATTTDNPEASPIIVALNYNIEEIQYLVRDDSLYNDWYLIADTALSYEALTAGAFGGLQLSLNPASRKAQELLASLPITTGYSGIGAQRSYTTPQQGLIQATDRNGTLVAGGSSRTLQDATTSLKFTTRPAPGAVNLEFGGDALSSYLVNFREASDSLELSYGSWTSGLSKAATSTINFAQDVSLTLVRTDSVSGAVSLGLRRSDELNPLVLISDAEAASQNALSTNSIFIPSGSGSWLETEGQRLGSTAASMAMITAGEWTPVARNSAGEELAVESINISANGIDVAFAGGIGALYNAAGTGVAQNLPGSGELAVTVQRLGRQANGLAFYEADTITGAVVLNGQSFLPGDTGYLQAALASAQTDGLILGSERLPEYGGELVITDMPLDATQNYGLLLLRNNNQNDLVSSYSQANPGGFVSMLSFVAPGRGVLYGIEDQPMGRTDADFNDLIVGIAATSFFVV